MQNPKIDIYRNGQYACSTTWSRTVRDALRRYAEKFSVPLNELRGVKCKSTLK
jgi:hypothetical protein